MRGEVRIDHSIYGVVVINGSLCSRVYGTFVQERTCMRTRVPYSSLFKAPQKNNSQLAPKYTPAK